MSHSKIICRTHLGSEIPFEQAKPYIIERLERKLTKGDGCWIWKGWVSPRGMGYLTVQGQTWNVSRLAYTLWVGPIPEGLYVCHRCDVPTCCRPDHLFVGNQEANLHDMCAKGRHWRAKATTCRRGHEYTPENTGRYRSNPSKRACKTCQRMHLRMKQGWSKELALSAPVTPHGYSRDRITGEVISTQDL